MNLKRLTDRQLVALKFKTWDKIPFGAGGNWSELSGHFPRQARILQAITNEEYRRERQKASNLAGCTTP